MMKNSMKKAKTANIKERASPKSDFLLDVAAQAFLEEGFSGASVGEIARRAHASKETFYSRYDTKNDLFEAVVRRLIDRFSGQVGEGMNSDAPLEKMLSAFSAKILEKALSDEGIALQKLINMESSRFPGLAKLYFELGPQRILRILGRYLDSQVAKKTLREVDGEIAAQHFMGILASDLMMRRALGILTEKPSARHIARRITQAVEVFMRAYGSGENAKRGRPTE